MHKRKLAFFLALALLLSLFSQLSPTVQAVGDSDHCGALANDSLRWSFDPNTGLLTISGSGAMQNYEAGDAPWYKHKDDITAVSLPAGLSGIGATAFYECHKLTSVTIPEGVTRIGDSAFYDCSALTSVVIPNSLTDLEARAFAYCSALTSLTIPDGVTGIGVQAFYGCSALGDVTIGNGVSAIGDYAFYQCSALSKLTIGSSLNRICDWAFAECGALSSLTIPDQVTHIGNHAFDNCGALTQLSLGKAVSHIGWCGFLNCKALTNVTIGSSLTSLGNYAFSNCGALTAIQVAQDNPNYSSLEGVLFDKDQTQLIQYPAGKTGNRYSIPDSVTCIASLAFLGCGALTEVTIPSSVTELQSGAFSGCSGLRTVTVPDSISTVSSSAFSGCSALTSVTLGNSVTSIGNWAFSECGALTSVEIPNSVTSIGDWAFSLCPALTSVTLGDSVTGIGAYAFYQCGALTSVTLDKSLTRIGDCAFEACSALTAVTLPDSVTSMGVNAFKECSKLGSVTIPAGVTRIDRGTFADCTALSSVSFPEGLKEIGPYAFQNCSALTELSLPQGLTSLAFRSFFNCASLTKLIVPNSQAYVYQTFGTDEDLKLLEGSLGPAKQVKIYGTTNSEAEPVLEERDNSGDLEKYAMHLPHFAEKYGYAFYDLSKNYSGACGDQLSWSFDPVSRTLTISGSGDMWDHEAGKAPWAVFSDQIEQLVLPDGLTGIGSHALYGCSLLSAVTIPSSVTKIGDKALGYGSNSEKIDGFTIYGYEDSAAQRYAEDHHFRFVSLDVNNPFEDVSQKDFFFNPVMWAVSNGITNGRDATHFAPSAKVKRSEAMAFFWRAQGEPAYAEGTVSPFKDVKKKHWYYDAVMWAVENEITEGTSPTKFSPNKTCVRSEILKFLYSAMGRPEHSGVNPYSDVKKKHWYYDSAIWAYENGLEKGSNGKFRPKTACTRAYVVTYLYRFLTGHELVP